MFSQRNNPYCDSLKIVLQNYEKKLKQQRFFENNYQILKINTKKNVFLQCKNNCRTFTTD